MSTCVLPPLFTEHNQQVMPGFQCLACTWQFYGRESPPDPPSASLWSAVSWYCCCCTGCCCGMLVWNINNVLYHLCGEPIISSLPGIVWMLWAVLECMLWLPKWPSNVKHTYVICVKHVSRHKYYNRIILFRESPYTCQRCLVYWR